MNKLHALVAIALCAMLAGLAVAAQDVETRNAISDSVASSASDAVSGGVGGAQSRQIYSQRHLSPHRMMHFGKRPAFAAPPSIINPFVSNSYDLLANQQEVLAALAAAQQQRRQQQQQQRLFQAQPEPEAFQVDLVQRTSLPAQRYEARRPLADVWMYGQTDGGSSNAELLDNAYKQLEQQPERLMKLISEDLEQTNAAAAVSAEANKQLKLQQQLQQQNQLQAIDVQARSHLPRTHAMSLPKEYLSKLLFGSAHKGGDMSLSNIYNKRPEQKDNIFMHFGK